MPNHVSHQISFDVAHLTKIRELIGGEDAFDFARLVPPPVHMYRGTLTSSLKHDDAKDFPCNWYDWQIANWGTKWNAYEVATGVDDAGGYVRFDTAGSVPRPIIVAFANAAQIDFTLTYYDEGGNFWGLERWAVTDGVASRVEYRNSLPEDGRSLCLALKGYDPENRDEGE